MPLALYHEGDVIISDHAESRKKLDGLHGRTNASYADHLTPRGVLQSRNIAAYAIEHTILLADDIGRRAIDVIASSYQRCEETAAHIIQAVGEYAVLLAREIKTRFRVSPNLAGLDLGTYAGLPYSKMDPEYTRPLLAWYRGDPEFPEAPELPLYTGGEPKIRFAERVLLETRAQLQGCGPSAIFNVSSSTATAMSIAMQRGLYSCEPKDMLAFPYTPVAPGGLEHWRLVGGIATRMSAPGFHEPAPSELLVPNQRSYEPPQFV